MRHEAILIVGGYGQVGRQIAAALAPRFPGRVIVAGRDQQRAAALAAEVGHGAAHRQLDMADPADDALDGAGLAIVCVERGNAAFARRCFERGAAYVDISASHAILAEIAAMDDLARRQGAAAILSVGLAPGLTNLLARYGASLLDAATAVQIGLLLGLGEAHGIDATRWILDQINRPFEFGTPAGPRSVQPFAEGHRIDFLGDLGPRMAYRFDFADQHILPRTLGIPYVATWLCFDSPLVTGALAALKSAGMLRRADRLSPRLIAGMTGLLPGGSDRFAVQAEVRGTKDGRQYSVRCQAEGHNEARATGLVAAWVAEQAMTADYPAGVRHIEQLVEPLAIFRHLREAGVRITVDAARSGAPPREAGGRG